MDTIFINTENAKTNESNRFRLYFTNKLDLRSNKTISLANLSIYYTWEIIKSAYNNNKFEISGPKWTETFDLPDGSYEISDIQDYFLKMMQKHKSTIKNNEESSILVYPNEVKNRIVFKIKTGYKLELLSKETQTLLGDGPLIDKNKDSNNVPQLDQVESILLHCNLVRNQYLQNSKLLYEFIPDKKFGQLISVKPPVFIQFKTSDTLFYYIEIWFTDQSNKSLRIDDKVSVTLIIQNNRLGFMIYDLILIYDL